MIFPYILEWEYLNKGAVVKDVGKSIILVHLSLFIIEALDKARNQRMGYIARERLTVSAHSKVQHQCHDRPKRD